MALNPLYQIQKRFIQVRKKLGKTQAEFATLTTLSQAQISQIETGARSVSEAVYVILFETINVNRSWLEKGEGPMFTEKPANALPGDPSIPKLTNPNERLTYLRIKEKLSQKEMAEKINVNATRLLRYEKGTSAISAKFVALVCEAFSVNSAWLLNGEGDMYSKPEKKTLVNDITVINVQVATQGQLLANLQKTIVKILEDNQSLKQQLSTLQREVNDLKKPTYH